MYTNQLECCALNEISDLSCHRTQKEAMYSFCQNHKVYGSSKLQTLGAFYIFSGVVKTTIEGIESLEHDEDNLAYAPDFAKFIRANRLGTVVELPARRNRKNAPGHTIKMYVWMPSPRAVQAWWDKNKGD